MGRLRFVGSGFLSSMPGSRVHAIVPHIASPQVSIRITAVRSATNQSPLGSAASVGLLMQTSATMARPRFCILCSCLLIFPCRHPDHVLPHQLSDAVSVKGAVPKPLSAIGHGRPQSSL